METIVNFERSRGYDASGGREILESIVARMRERLEHE